MQDIDSKWLCFTRSIAKCSRGIAYVIPYRLSVNGVWRSFSGVGYKFEGGAALWQKAWKLGAIFNLTLAPISLVNGFFGDKVKSAFFPKAQININHLLTYYHLSKIARVSTNLSLRVVSLEYLSTAFVAPSQSSIP